MVDPRQLIPATWRVWGAMGALLAGMVVAGGCARPDATADASRLAEGRRAFHEERHAETRLHMRAALPRRGDAPHLPEALLYKGRAALAMGQPADALASFNRALDSAYAAPYRAPLHAARAHAYTALGRTREALADQEALPGLGYPPDEALALRIRILEAGNFRAAAATARREMLRLYPQSPFCTEEDRNLPTPYAVHLRDVFPSPERAGVVQQRLASAGYEEFLLHEPTGAGSTYRIQVGAFRDISSANRRIADLRAHGFDAVLR